MLDSEVRTLIENKSEPIPFAGCWIWLGALQPDGRAVWPKAGKNRSVARITYQAYNKTIPAQLLVRHTCDIACCVNPAHLILGTDSDNMRDKVLRGRSSTGEKNGRAILTEESVKEIRTLYTAGKNIAQIASITQIARHNVSDIVNLKTWRYLL